MFFKKWPITVICWCVLTTMVRALVDVEPSNYYDQNEYLDYEKHFRVFWKVNDTHIEMEIHAITTGWVGIGFSPFGGMEGADIIVGWVRNGQAHITDRYGPWYGGYPPTDREENVELLGGSECDGVTMIKFRRQLAACEKYHDRPITKGTVRIIYAYGVHDPVLNDLFFTDKHRFNHRGTKSILLLGRKTRDKEQLLVQEAPDLQTFDIVNDGKSFETKSTYYKCRLLRLPDLKEKHHIIKIEPVIEEKNRRFVHHLVIQQCPYSLQKSDHDGESRECYTANSLPETRGCLFITYGWGVGGGSTSLPKNAGIPIGVPGEAQYVILETHYDNPTNEVIRDSSGVRFTYTSDLRENDAGFISMGHTVSGNGLLVPPNTDSYLVYGECGAECLGGAMEVAEVDSINIFSAFLHSHVAGRAITLRQIRNTTELPPPSMDQTYDFNFQETRAVIPERTVRKGDWMQIICNYSTRGKKTLTESGLATTEEMCLAFVMYYPKIPLNHCTSVPVTGAAEDILGPMLGFLKTKKLRRNGQFRDIVITDPKEKLNVTLEQEINNHLWTKAETEKLSYAFHQSPRSSFCMGPQPKIPLFSQIQPAVIEKPYLEKSTNCVAPSSGFSNALIANSCPVDMNF
ncbi:unnamed protein product [Clavelina lepadiformis]|uniref:DOMON domain-containing protein n=1 Tax=Clavelina lepadiformis TaxID=159417 RepID=A0ABP0EX24_CLALP